MNKYVNQNIQKIKAYCPPLSGRRNFKGLLLDFNEKTIPVSNAVSKALIDFVNDDQIQVYPQYDDLCKKIAKYARVREENIMITNGSDQGIDLIFRTFTNKKDTIIIPSPSFAMFYQCANLIGNKVKMPLYKSDGSFPYDKVISLIKEEVKLVVLCNPNNPTGTIISLEQIIKIIEKALKYNALVYVDEAYFEFCKITAVSLIKKYPNLIITRTFSKAFGLAALRIGYTISNERNITEMLKVRGPYDMNMPAVVAAKAALDDLNTLNKYVDEVMNKAKPMVEKFFQDIGVEFYPSCANFLLFKKNNSKAFVNKLKKMGILIRERNSESIKQSIRVTIGTVDQMKKFINRFKNA